MNRTAVNTARLAIIVSMLIFGTIGIFVRHVPMPSSVIALVRGMVGTLFLLVFSRLRKTPVDWAGVRKSLGLLILSGAFIGFNWILLFEAYRYTTVATATLCYYLAPAFVILASPVLFREKLTLRKGICVAVALAGMVFVSGVAETGFSGSGEFWGVLFGVGAAVLYASVVLMNKMLTGVPAFDRTIVQLGAAALALLPYVVVTEWGTAMDWSGPVIPLLLVMGIVHTGFAYALYFGGIKELPAQTSALLSYIDPVSAIILSAVFLREGLTASGVIGAVLVLGATLFSELSLPHKSK
ncbi:MAG: DMT family transporter [Ruminococcaceae bacterium]|nr:DMT family transporter [Oscillospiraceae bacterium]